MRRNAIKVPLLATIILMVGLCGANIRAPQQAFADTKQANSTYAALSGTLSMGQLRSRLSQDQTLYSLQGAPNDGAFPLAGVIADETGALYGTTFAGGIAGCISNCGTVFKLAPTNRGYVESFLYEFQGGKDGSNPGAGLIRNKQGVLYGTAGSGGTGACSSGPGCGVVFKLTPSGSGYTESVLYSFQGSPNDGAGPYGLIIGKSGALYGTTSSGGLQSSACPDGNGCGTVFRLTPSLNGYVETILYFFQGGGDGANPVSGLVADKVGALYGVTIGGGLCGNGGCGTVFKLTPNGSAYTESVIYRFETNSPDGNSPLGGVVIDDTGALYGTTSSGGGGDPSCVASGGCGVIYKLTPSGGRYTESLLHIFQGESDGGTPIGDLLPVRNGMLFGTTSGLPPGGDTNSYGTVYEVGRSGKSYRVLYNFEPYNPDGLFPNGDLIEDRAGALYGTTEGGPYLKKYEHCGGAGLGCGVVFRLTL